MEGACVSCNEHLKKELEEEEEELGCVHVFYFF